MRSSLDSTATASTGSSPAKPRSLRGYACIATAALFWGISASLGRAAFTGRLISLEHARHTIDPLILAQSRTTISFLVLAPVLLLRRGRTTFTMPRGDQGRSLLLGVLGLAVSNYFYYLAIQRTTVATAIILQYTAPIWVLVWMVLRRVQRATATRVAAVALAVGGCVLAIGIVGPGRFKLDLVGVIAAQVAAFSFAFYNVLGARLLQHQERWRVLLWTLLGASVFWVVVNPPWKILAVGYSPQQWAFLFVFAMTSMMAPFSFYLAGLRYLDATRAIVTSCLEPVFTIAIAAVFLGELVGPLQVLGIVIVLLATILVQLPDRASHQPPPVMVGPVE